MADKPRELQLYELFLELFDGPELLRVLRWVPQGEDLVQTLPPRTAALKDLAQAAVTEISHRGIADAIFHRLYEVRPNKFLAIAQVAALWGVSPRPAAPQQKNAASASSDEDLSVDNAIRGALERQLEHAQRRQQALRQAALDTKELDEKILELKRKLREGRSFGPGYVLGNDRYVLLRKIGSGGFATVWQAMDEVQKATVAVKVLHSEMASDSRGRERFYRGARAMQRLQHPNIVRVLESDEQGPIPFFVMEYIDGLNLRQFVEARRPDVSEVIKLVVPVGEALAEAHALRMVHRDVKPANIIIDKLGQPRLTDFDLVRAADTTGGTRGGGLGTIVYAAPELLKAAEDADPRADVYGLGMTTMFAIHGRELPYDIVREEDSFLAQLRCPPEVKDVLRRAIAWKRSERYPDVRRFCADLREAWQRSLRPLPLSTSSRSGSGKTETHLSTHPENGSEAKQKRATGSSRSELIVLALLAALTITFAIFYVSRTPGSDAPVAAPESPTRPDNKIDPLAPQRVSQKDLPKAEQQRVETTSYDTTDEDTAGTSTTGSSSTSSDDSTTTIPPADPSPKPSAKSRRRTLAELARFIKRECGAEVGAESETVTATMTVDETGTIASVTLEDSHLDTLLGACFSRRAIGVPLKDAADKGSTLNLKIEW